MNEIYLILAAIAGVLVRDLLAIQAARRKANFSWASWFEKQWFITVVSLVIAVVIIVFFKDDHQKVFGMEWHKGMAFMAGFFSQVLFRRISEMYDPRKKKK